MDIVTEQLIEYLRAEPPNLTFTPKQVIIALKKAADSGDMETFETIANGYLDFTTRYNKKYTDLDLFEAQMGALENLACFAVIADLNLATPTKIEEKPYNMYQDPSRHGNAMKAFMRYSTLDANRVCEEILRNPKSN